MEVLVLSIVFNFVLAGVSVFLFQRWSDAEDAAEYSESNTNYWRSQYDQLRDWADSVDTNQGAVSVDHFAPSNDNPVAPEVIDLVPEVVEPVEAAKEPA